MIITDTENTAAKVLTKELHCGNKSGRILEKGMKALFFLCACVSVAAVVVICVFMFAKGCPAIAKIGVKEFLLGSDWSPRNVPVFNIAVYRSP